MKATLCDRCGAIIPAGQGLTVSFTITNSHVANKRGERDYCDICAKVFCECIGVETDTLNNN